VTSEKKVLFQNTIFLYILTFSSQFFNLIIIPYETRILGPEIYGKIGFSLALMTYVQLILDFGFLLSATQEVSLHRDDCQYLSKIYSCVNYLKFILSILLFLIFVLFSSFIPLLKEDFFLFFLYYVAFVLNAFLPDFLYRGLENMKLITIRTVLIKFFSMLFIFLFLRSSSDYYVIPILNIIGNLIALITIIWYTKKHYSIRLMPVSISYFFKQIKLAFPFFVSRVVSTFYTAFNTFILGILYPTGTVLGCFTTADKLITTSKSFVSPVADSIYPYMVKNKDFKLIKKLLRLFMPMIIIVGILVMIFSEQICVLLFGEEYYSAGMMLRCLIPIAMVVFPSYLLAFPTMNPLGLSKYANFSNILGATCQILFLLLLWLFNSLNVISICIISSITEIIVFLYRLIIILRHKNNTMAKV
jgi:PST family polysaccharide transporter